MDNIILRGSHSLKILNIVFVGIQPQDLIVPPNKKRKRNVGVLEMSRQNLPKKELEARPPRRGILLRVRKSATPITRGRIVSIHVAEDNMELTNIKGQSPKMMR